MKVTYATLEPLIWLLCFATCLGAGLVMRRFIGGPVLLWWIVAGLGAIPLMIFGLIVVGLFQKKSKTHTLNNQPPNPYR